MTQDDLVERAARAMFAAHNDQDCGHDDCFYDAPIWPESDAQDSRSGARAYFLDLAEAAIAERLKWRKCPEELHTPSVGFVRMFYPQEGGTRTHYIDIPEPPKDAT